MTFSVVVVSTMQRAVYSIKMLTPEDFLHLVMWWRTVFFFFLPKTFLPFQATL
jgi:hypothetical protein